MSTAPTTYKLIDRRIGLLSGSVLLLGSVIGISVFFLPGELIGEAGPSILVALGITAIPMALSVLGLLQLGGAMPVAGGMYVYGSRLVSPAWGYLSIWLLLPAIWSTLAFTALGFAEFARVFVGLPVELLAVVVIAAFAGLNLRGVTVVAWAQLAMVAAIGAAILAFVGTGLPQVDVANYTPLLPAGVAPALIAVVSLYIPFQGFSMIIELGEELEDPIRNIPRVLVIGMGLAVLLSVALVAVFVGLDRFDVLGALGEGGIAQAAANYLPGWVAGTVVLGAVLGAFTTLNAIITAYSRTLMRAGRDGVLSPRLATLSERTQVPHLAVLALTVPPMVIVLFRPSVVLLTVFLALVILFGNFVGSVALWNLPKRFPAAYEHSIYRLPMWLLRTAAIGSAAFAVLFWLAIVASAPAIIVLLLIVIAAGVVGYRLRIHRLQARGIDLRGRLRQLHDHEAVAAGVAPEPDDALDLVAAGRPDTPTYGDVAGTRPAPARAPAIVRAPADDDRDDDDRDDPAPSRRARTAPRRILVATPSPSQRAAARAGSNGGGPAGRAGSNGGAPRSGDAGGAGTEAAIAARLTEVPGLGPRRRERLVAHFGSLGAVADATADELCRVDGIGEVMASQIRERLAPADR